MHAFSSNVGLWPLRESWSAGWHTGRAHQAERGLVGKQQWRDIRRVCKLGAEGGLYSVEIPME